MAEIKAYVWPLVIASVSVLAPIHAVLLTTGLLIFADLTFGVWAAKKRGESITSARLRDSVSKLFIYHTVLISGYFAQSNLMYDWVPVVKIAGSLIGLVEIKSLLENGEVILGKPVFKTLIKILGSKSQK